MGKKFLALFISALFALPVVTPAVVTGTDVQNMINSSYILGLPQVNLPNETIYVDQTVRIYPGMKNFRLQGGDRTKFVRNTSADIPLFIIGLDATIGYENNYLNQTYQSFDIDPVQDGATTVTVNTALPLLSGWYVIAGNDPVNDVVVHSSGSPTFNYKRELVRGTPGTGNQLVLSHPVGREFENPKLWLVQPDGQPVLNGVVESITFSNIQFDGRFRSYVGNRVDNTNTKSSRANRVVTAGLARNLVFEDVVIRGFRNSGLSMKLCRSVTVTDSFITDGQTTTLGYGIEVMASRFVFVRNTRFSNHRWGVLFNSGSTDCEVTDCFYEDTPGSGFDVSHGSDERRINYIRCIANTFSIGNPAYRAGVRNATLLNCSARNSMTLWPNATNISISGKYPGQEHTAPMIQFMTEGGGLGTPQGIIAPVNVYLSGGSCERFEADGNTVQLSSMSGQQHQIPYIEAVAWTFTNPNPARGAAFRVTDIAGTGRMKFTNCNFRSTYTYDAPVILQAGNWDVEFIGCHFTKILQDTPFYQLGLHMKPNSTGTVRFTGWNTYNGSVMTPANVWQEGTASIFFP